jgi:cell division septum initiation protein DivIVA
MQDTQLIDQIAQRVERVLMRHEELLRANALLTQQVQELSVERDLLKSRLNVARQRMESLIERLPDNTISGELP